jgi:hypothetical protein
MGCERPSGIGISIVRDSSIKFPSNWSGELPPRATRDELRNQMASMFRRRNLSRSQTEEVLDFLKKYEERYYEAPDGQCYHRQCGGGSMVQGELGVYCANCGKLPDLLPPTFMR